MESLGFMDELLDFASDIGEEDEDDDVNKKNKNPRSALSPLRSGGVGSAPSSFDVLDPGLVEEELEWLSNKDAFPEVETFVDIFPVSASAAAEAPFAKHHSPVSVLENSTSSSNSTITSAATASCGGAAGGLLAPVRRPRSKRRRRRRRVIIGELERQPWTSLAGRNAARHGASGAGAIGRKCLHCGAEKTPQWRAGPMGPKTLCNACGVRYKSGRLVPEYRPANSPTFSTELHSNSHRKIMEMRRQKLQMGMLFKPVVDKG